MAMVYRPTPTSNSTFFMRFHLANVENILPTGRIKINSFNFDQSEINLCAFCLISFSPFVVAAVTTAVVVEQNEQNEENPQQRQ